MMADDRNCHHERSLSWPLLLFLEATIQRKAAQALMLSGKHSEFLRS